MSLLTFCITMEPKDIARILQSSAMAGVEKHLSASGNCSKISKAQAYHLYGRSNVDRWIAEGLVVSDGKKLNPRKLADVARASNRITYLPSNER